MRGAWCVKTELAAPRHSRTTRHAPPMFVVHFLLNLAALLLWLGWRSRRLAAPARPSGIALLSTLKRADPAGGRIWIYPAALGGLLFLRAVFYWELGPSLHWNPSLSFGALTVFFRSNLFGLTLLF